MPRGPARSQTAPSGKKDTGEEDRLALQRLARGDSGALKLVYQRFGGRAYAICLRILKDRSEAEEVLQETFMEVWRRARDYDPKRGGIEAWIATIARTRSIDHLRSQRTSEKVTMNVRPSGTMSVAPASPDQSAAASEDKAAVAAAIQNLPPEQRGVIELAFFEGLSHSEIAARTGDPLGTVKTRVRLGMEKLASLLPERRT